MKILIADAEPGHASGLAAWLVANGWDAPGIAATSDAAVEWINQNGRLDVLVTEVFLQPADGLTLRESLLSHLPKMKTIFVSAHDVSEHAGRMEGCPLLLKPVSGETLDAAIRSLYESKPTVVAVASVAATPRAVAVATARPAVAAAVPRAVGVATPKPAAVPVAVARPAVAAAAPIASPKPVAVPVAPVAVAKPVAQAVARPAAAAAAPVATPKPVAVSVAPVAVAKPVAQAVVRPAVAQAVPVVAKVSAAVVVAKKTPPSSEIELPPDELVGTTISNYQIEAKIGTSSQGGIYRATQTNMGRHVRFYTLDRERAADPAEIQKFIANASMKANVSHPYIFAVYEAGEGGGIYFYSCEYAPCRSLGQLREAGLPLDENIALQAMKVVSEALGYFSKENITHNLISENAILLVQQNRPRLANIAAYQTTPEFDRAAEMIQLGGIIASVLPAASQASGVGQLARSLAAGEITFPDWPAFTKAIEALEPKIAPEDAYKLDAQERAAIRMVEEAKKRQKQNMIINTVISLTLLAAALGSVWWFLLRNKGASSRAFDRMIEVPAGEFIYQDGQKVTLPAFNIDEFEVTIAQYAQFLADIKAHPEKLKAIEHPDQPQGKSHIPEKWADEDLATEIMYGYYARAQQWGRYKDAALDVNSPVFGVDWFDAYAYAKWKGRRLPSEQEWEKAARGTEGFQYPWGNEDEPTWVNSGNDTNPDPKKGGEVDGQDRWSPVDGMKKDKSPSGVRGMAGNVSEWTATMDVDPKMSSAKVPVIRGGNWRTPKDYAVTRRVLKLTELQADEALGFRTVSDTSPPK